MFFIVNFPCNLLVSQVSPKQAFFNEKLKYSLVYELGILCFPAGEIEYSTTKKIYNSQNVIFIEASGKSLKSYELIYSMNENIKTCVEAFSLNPIWSEVKINQNGRESFVNSHFEWDKNKLYIENKEYNKPTEHDSIKLNGNALDFLSAGLYIRNLNFSNAKKGDVFTLNIISGKLVHKIRAKYLGNENIFLPNVKNIKTIKMSVETIPGDFFKNGDEIYIWLTDDEKHIPLQFESKVLIGRVKISIADCLKIL